MMFDLPSTQLAVAIMAAGKGTRMKSEHLPKVMHTLAGRSMILHVLHTASKLKPSRILPIVGHFGEKVKAHVEAAAPAEIQSCLQWVTQHEQLGTGHAVQQVVPCLNDFSGHLIVLNGDVPLLAAETLQQLLQEHLASGHAATLLTTRLPDPTGYGRILKNNAGYFIGIREHKDCDAAELRIDEVNTGIYVFDWQELALALPRLTNDNAKGEYYLTDVLGLLVQKKLTVGVHCLDDAREVLGINSKGELAQVEQYLQERIQAHWLEQGVTLRNPASITIECEVELAADVEILSGTVLQGKTRVGKASCLGPNTLLQDAEIGENCQISLSVVRESVVQDHVSVGPFAHIRPESVLETHAKVGNFVELKKTRLGQGAKASHLTYLGDAEIGARTNIGAGTITCNYDGAHKHKTLLAEGVFIGSNSTLVAPLEVGQEAYVAAGSVITGNVPAGALGLGRCRQTNKEGWVAARRPRK